MTQHKNVYAALAAAQAEMGKALKDANNPHFKSRYADLANVMDACMPALTKHGIALTQPFVAGEFGNVVKTVLHHGESDTSVECSVPLLLGKQDMQGLGSAYTYARRYGLMAMAGIAPEDDDGNAAAQSAPKRNPTSEGLGDAWRDSVLDSIPEEATPREKAKAFADAICAEFAGKGEKALNNAWERRKKYIANFEANHPDLHARVVDAFENRMNELHEAKGIAAE